MPAKRVWLSYNKLVLESNLFSLDWSKFLVWNESQITIIVLGVLILYKYTFFYYFHVYYLFIYFSPVYCHYLPFLHIFKVLKPRKTFLTHPGESEAILAYVSFMRISQNNKYSFSCVSYFLFYGFCCLSSCAVILGRHITKAHHQLTLLHTLWEKSQIYTISGGWWWNYWNLRGPIIRQTPGIGNIYYQHYNSSQ